MLSSTQQIYKGKRSAGKLNVQATLRRLGGTISLTTDFIFVYLQSTSPFHLKMSLCGFMHLSLWHFSSAVTFADTEQGWEKVTAQSRVTASHTAGYQAEIHSCDLWRCMHVRRESLHDQVVSAGASPTPPPPTRICRWPRGWLDMWCVSGVTVWAERSSS